MNILKSLLLLMVTAFFVGCGGGDSSTPAGEAAPAAGEPAAGGDAALIEEGKALFTGTAICFTCHGQDGTGMPQLAPDLTDDVWLNIEAPPTVEKVAAVIKNGVAEPKEHQAPMPAMVQLNDDQVNALATYVLSLSS